MMLLKKRINDSDFTKKSYKKEFKCDIFIKKMLTN